MKRTHTCGELTAKEKGKEVCLQGWVHTHRNHGGLIFINMRDRYGITQAVVNPDSTIFKDAEKLHKEDCVEIYGKVISRPDNMKNPDMKTGEIEIEVNKIAVLCKTDVLPTEVEDEVLATEDTRMKYRYLDLRRPIVQKNIIMRHNAAQAARKFLSSQGFLEIETPMLVRSTPEGARDYIVPSRVNPGRFYALPQSPQLYKQLLMVAGFDRYFQLPRCLRDEDLRADRQPTHTQIDLEMSFPELDDLFAVGEGVMKNIFKECLDYDVDSPFPRIGFQESMDKYGTDKPDIRYELFLNNVSDIVKNSEFKVFKDIVAEGGSVKCINPPAEFTRKDIDKYEKMVKSLGAKGLAWAKVADGKLDGGISKFLSEEEQKNLIKTTGAKDKSTIFFMAGKMKLVNQYLDKLRQDVAKDLKLYNPKDFKFCWITEFPLFEWNEDENKWDAMHHLFCMPKEEDLKHLEDDPGKVYCTQYDFVLNGVELASGSIRINNPEIQERVMKVIGMDKKEAEKKFGFLLKAFSYGAPPHGGMGIGFDRVVALMCGTTDIREVIAFPKNKNAESLMDESPNEATSEQLKELHIKKDLKK